MPWHDPASLLDFSAGEIPTAAKLDRLKDNLAALKNATRAMWILRTELAGAPANSWGTLAFTNELVDDWNGNSTPPTQNFGVAGAGLYTVSANIVYSGATGSGEVAVRIQRYSGAGVLLDTAGSATAPLNGGVSLTIFSDAAVGDFFIVQGLTNATGTGHSWIGRFFMKQETAI